MARGIDGAVGGGCVRDEGTRGGGGDVGTVDGMLLLRLSCPRTRRTRRPALGTCRILLTARLVHMRVAECPPTLPCPSPLRLARVRRFPARTRFPAPHQLQVSTPPFPLDKPKHTSPRALEQITQTRPLHRPPPLQCGHFTPESARSTTPLPSRHPPPQPGSTACSSPSGAQTLGAVVGGPAAVGTGTFRRNFRPTLR